MYILNDFPKLWNKEDYSFLYDVTLVFPQFYNSLDFTYLSGSALKSVKSRFHCILRRINGVTER
jgi:hypothetical protein